MNLDNFTRHVGAITIALLAVLFSAAVVWQIVHGHEVDALLAGLVGTTLGYLIPSPTQTGRVTVENEPSDPIPTTTTTLAKARAKDRGAVDVLTVALVALIVVVILVLLKAV